MVSIDASPSVQRLSKDSIFIALLHTSVTANFLKAFANILKLVPQVLLRRQPTRNPLNVGAAELVDVLAQAAERLLRTAAAALRMLSPRRRSASIRPRVQTTAGASSRDGGRWSGYSQPFR